MERMEAQNPLTEGGGGGVRYSLRDDPPDTGLSPISMVDVKIKQSNLPNACINQCISGRSEEE